jgi:RNA polymerase sigma-70 factor (ECF subfamily)
VPNKTNPHEEEAELIVSATEGNREAFGVLYERYYNNVFRHLFFLVNNHHSAEDLTAQTFLKAFEAIYRYEIRDVSFLAWLLRIAYNLSMNYRRNRSNGTDRLPGVEPPDGRHCPEVLVETIEDHRWVRRMVESLKEDQRMVVVMHFFDGLSYADIAKVLGKSIGAVRVIQFRAIRALRESAPA